MTETVIFGWSKRSDVTYVLVYLENVAQPSASAEEKARAVIRLFHGQAFQNLLQEVHEEKPAARKRKKYELVREALEQEFEKAPEPRKAVENVLNLTKGPNEDVLSLIARTKALYGAAGFAIEQKMFFLSKTAVIN